MINKKEFEEIVKKLEDSEEWTIASKELLNGFTIVRRDAYSKSNKIISKLIKKLNECSGSQSNSGWMKLFTPEEAKEISDHMDYSDGRE